MLAPRRAMSRSHTKKLHLPWLALQTQNRWPCRGPGLRDTNELQGNSCREQSGRRAPLGSADLGLGFGVGASARKASSKSSGNSAKALWTGASCRTRTLAHASAAPHDDCAGPASAAASRAGSSLREGNVKSETSGVEGGAKSSMTRARVQGAVQPRRFCSSYERSEAPQGAHHSGSSTPATSRSSAAMLLFWREHSSRQTTCRIRAVL